jgi:transcription antitermination protein NusB
MSSAEAPAKGKDRVIKGSRRRSRELALQSLYQWLLNGDAADSLCKQAEEKKDYARVEKVYFELLTRGVVERAADLQAALQPFLDRPAQQLSPIEHALLLLGAYELMFMPDVPYRVAINEAVELAKSYGGTDGHKYVNGVLDKLAAQVRPGEAKRN